MSNKPWEEKVTETDTENKELTRNSKDDRAVSTPVLTILLSLFFLIIIGILFFVLYTSNGGSDEKAATSGFYGSSKTVKKSKKEASQSSESEEQTVTETTEAETTQAETTTSSDGEDTLTVQGGEGAAAIASRAGISVEKLYELNPDHMTKGYWYANPGDNIKIK
ncbi:SAG1386/EF1546 family surface-associated protein [Streptococcus devriesei]|uniref:SAG1386/EF1546 family surface-associated protein n=1 Tax=Streptococcus devriesei TaxID=231233 RepID=UPI0004212A76|nr:SAG1386/EF1546 family surface-associated protein [Streptococcus devriesei]